MDYAKFREIIKSGTLAPLYNFTGEEDYLKDFCVTLIAKRFFGSEDDGFNLHIFDSAPESSDFAEINETLPMMAERKLIVFRRCDLFKLKAAEAERYAEIFADIAPFNCVLVIDDDPAKSRRKKSGDDGDKEKKSGALADALKDHSVGVNFPYLKEDELKRWLINGAQKNYGKRLSSADAGYIIKITGRSLGALHSEIDKIAAYCGERDSITRADIEAVSEKGAEDKIYRFLDALFALRRSEAFACLREVRDYGSPPQMVSAMLINNTRLAYRAKLLLLDGENIAAISDIMGDSAAASIAMRRAQAEREEPLRDLIRMCREADYKVKNGLMDGWAALDLIVAEYHT